AMKAGLEVSEMLSTVSRRYAMEIQTVENGYGLDWLTRQRANRLIGITNGVDYEVWNPATDPELASHFSIDDMAGKQACKRDLLEAFSLPVEMNRPIIANITRLTAQKGIDLMMQIAGEIVHAGAYVISLGSGEKKYEDFWQSLRDYAPRQVGVYRGYSEPLAHRIEAGADMFMMPSKFEPCGLNQMYSLRYGTVPIVRKTGGLADTVREYDPETGEGTGFVFEGYDPAEFRAAIDRALTLWPQRDRWQRLMRNGMS